MKFYNRVEVLVTKKISTQFGYALIMTAVNLVMRSVSVSFNAYLTSKIGSSGIGLFQLIMTVYGLAVTISSGGVKLSAMRLTVQTEAANRYDTQKTMRMIMSYSVLISMLTALALNVSSGFIAAKWIGSAQAAESLKILSYSLPFTSLSAALGGYFTAKNKIPQYSAVQMLEQLIKIAITVMLLNKYLPYGNGKACTAIVIGMTLSEMISYSMSFILKQITHNSKKNYPRIEIKEFLRIALPDAAGSICRNILLTVEHLLIPIGFKKSGANSSAALSAYGNIHAMVLPVLLYPNAILQSVSTLLIPSLAGKNELGNREEINITAKKNLKLSFIYSLCCASIMALFAPLISQTVYKSDEAVLYIRILAPLVPIMYLDTVTDGILKGLDQQLYSMRYNIIDSALCVILVYLILPRYSVKGYLLILYVSEIINFYLSFGRLITVCDIGVFTKIKDFSRPHTNIPIRAQKMKY